MLNIITGYGAGILVHAEMNGISAVYITAILDSHFVSSETLQGFAPVINDLLQVTNVNFADVTRFKKFKEVLKDVNSRDHNIYN